MLDTQSRTVKNRLLEPLVSVFGRFHPITLSVIGLVMILIAFWLLIQQAYWWAFLFWFLNRFFDGIDGIVARHTERQTDLGGYVDIVLDFVAYALVPIGLVIGDPNEIRWLALSGLLATFYVNAASWMMLAAILEKRDQGASARGETTTVTIPEGLVGGFLTIVFFSLFILLPEQLVVLFVTMSILVLVGVIQRLWWAARHL